MDRNRLEKIVRKATKAGLTNDMKYVVIEETTRRGIQKYHLLENREHPELRSSMYFWTMWGWLDKLENQYSEDDARATAKWAWGIEADPKLIKIKM